VGAWIETTYIEEFRSKPIVAPRVGAWIETRDKPAFGKPWESPPAWGRGLKRNFRQGRRALRYVAPRVGAWIETHQIGANYVY